MTDHSAVAVANAISLEVKKTGLSQGQGADWRLSFKIEESELCDRLRRAVMGTRYQMVLVELNEDETPKEVMSNSAIPAGPNDKPPASEDSATPARARKSWDEMLPAAQAGVLCNEPAFGKYLGEAYGYINVCDANDAANVVRELCNVGSRKQIKEGTLAYETWIRITQGYRTWQLAAQVVPI